MLVKEVKIEDAGDRFVICRNPEQADRDQHVCDDLVARLTEKITVIRNDNGAAERNDKRGQVAPATSTPPTSQRRPPARSAVRGSPRSDASGTAPQPAGKPPGAPATPLPTPAPVAVLPATRRRNILGSADNGSPSPRKRRLTWGNADWGRRRRVTRRSGSPWSGPVFGSSRRDQVTDHDDLSRCDTGRQRSS